MIIELGLTGNDRKELVKVVSEIIGAPAVYQYMPTCSYIIDGCYAVTKDGALDISNQADEMEVQHLIDELIHRGYNIPTAEDETTASEDKENSLTVELPLELIDDSTIDRLRKIVENKGELFKSAFKTDSLEIQTTEKTVDFPWFTVEQDGDADAYCTFISMLCEFAKNRNRINNKPDTSDNEKYAFRCFLIRIGMVGTEYKAARKVLLRNLTGSSAFRHGSNS